MRRTPLRRVSKKRQTVMPAYINLINKLRELCDNKSELSGKSPDWLSGYKVEPHHVNGRRGKLLLDPFGIIMLVRIEHDIEEGKIKGKKVGKERLLEIVKEKRLAQGFVPS